MTDEPFLVKKGLYFCRCFVTMVSASSL